MGRKDDFCALAGQVLDGGDGASDTGIIGDHTLLKRDIEVSADEHSVDASKMHDRVNVLIPDFSEIADYSWKVLLTSCPLAQHRTDLQQTSLPSQGKTC